LLSLQFAAGASASSLRSCASLRHSVGHGLTQGTFGFPKKTVSLERWIAFKSLLPGTAYYWRGMHGTFNGIPLKEIIALKNKWSDFQPLLHIVAVSSRGSSLRLHDLSREIHHFEINVGLP
jgi:hypothetical protein